ncbi:MULTISPECIES: Na/Pi cotransporter family protein [unclassified Symbiopectobacterium]|uniref:Na/Pi cotransporter family protein n=1 Tax=unclassified Symbiopectobacterium TaxID=2794573 RepID=UPI002227B451|nr:MULTISPECIES: Na/Pi cotransporter family protein [unclassified Symbiopectobacterium]MCW2475419.1 Na/Pi cotransporter family protein [Candidatus Symbiopectobacterium sp. NZEC151]MCW2486398.1 Na/Pi cotransporter family protein [Candidatus Symbiopectobacterium sp. NZEC127]
MLTLLHLLSSVALLVWGTHIVRTGIMRVYGANLRRILSASIKKTSMAFLAGLGVTALVQSSNATALLAISFVSQQLIALSPALVIMLGADVGTALMARILTFDLGWLSPLLLLCGIVAFLSNRKARVGQLGRVGIGLGLILLALELIVAAAAPITHSSAILVIFTSISDDTLLALLLGAVFAMVSYSSLAAVLLTATLAATALLPLKMALCIVIGANLGSGVLAILGGRGQSASARQLVLGSMLFKIIGCVLILPWLAPLALWISSTDVASDEAVIYFHVVYNLLRCLLMLPLVTSMARLCRRLVPHEDMNNATAAPRYLDNSALDTPSLALANAVRETLRLGDVVAQMLERFRLVLLGDREQKREISRLDEEADMLHSAIKLYLAQIRQDDLGEEDSRRWAEVIDTALNLKQAGGILEHISSSFTNKALDARLSLSSEGMEELLALHQRLTSSLSLAMSVFLTGDMTNAKRLRRAKHRLILLGRRYSHAHVERLHQQNPQSLETSSLHMGLLGDIRRLNSLFCAVAYHVLEPDPEDSAE